MLDTTLIAAWIGLLVAIGAAVSGFIKFLFWLIDEWRKRQAQSGLTVPKRTLHLAMKMASNYRWYAGHQDTAKTMNVVGSVFATNISSVPLRSPQVTLRYGFMGRRHTFGMVLTAGDGPRPIYGMNDIPPGETRNLSFDFWVFPALIKDGKPFISHSVAVMDQFGNRHVLKRVVFLPN